MFGVTEGAISRAVKTLNIGVVKNVTLESAHKVVEKNLNTLDQLQKINTYANELLDLLMRMEQGGRGGSSDPRIPGKEGQDRQGEDFVKEFKFKDPRELALRGYGRDHGVSLSCNSISSRPSMMWRQWQSFSGKYSKQSGRYATMYETRLSGPSRKDALFEGLFSQLISVSDTTGLSLS